MPYRVYVDSFSALDDVPRKNHSDPIEVGRVLARVGRFSVFEATENQRLAGTIEHLGSNGWFDYEPEGYPWTRATVTNAGRQALGLETD